MTALKRILVHSSWFIVVLLGFGAWGLWFALPLRAACYCQDPTASNCRCTGTPPAGAKNEAATGGIAVTCDTPAEANSIFAIKAPICGSSPEIVPACAPNKALPSEYTCYGAEFATGTSTVPTEAFSGLTRVDGVTFNGVPYPDARSVLACNSIAFCCARSDIQCDDTKVPSTPSSCSPQNQSITPPVNICGVVAGNPNTQPNFTGQSDTDARIYFPHVKNTSSITYLLQSMFRPISWTIDEIKKNVVYSKIFEHQGINDATPVINRTDNNSSVIPNRSAPAPIFDFAHPPPGVPDNGSCVVSNVRTNPGDDLLGKKILADLEYTQKFKYDLLKCTKYTGASTDRHAKGCCPGAGAVGCQVDEKGNTTDAGCTCGPVYKNLPTKGKNLVYTKSPFLEYLYQNLVAGPAAIYKRFVAQDTAKDIEDIPTKATYLATAPEISRGPSNLQNTPTDIYFPHLGSIYDYFLKNLQKLLRPKDTADTTTIIPFVPGTTNLNLTCQNSCSHPNLPDSLKQIASIAGEVYGVPPSVILGLLFSEGGLNNPISPESVGANHADQCSCSGVSGACGPGQFLGSFSYVTAFKNKLSDPNVQSLIQNMGWQIGPNYSPDRCQFSDVIFGIAAKVGKEHTGDDYTTHCNTTGQCESQTCAGVELNNRSGASSCSDWTDKDVVTAARQYLGYCEESNHVPLYSYDSPSYSCKNDPNECYQQKLLNFMANSCQQTFSGSSSTSPATVPPNSTDFVVSGTPTQICQAVGYGIRQQGGTTNCIDCANGKFLRKFTCPGPIVNRNVCTNKFDNYTFNLPDYIPSPPDPDNPNPGPYPDNTCVQCRDNTVYRLESCDTISTVDLCRGQPNVRIPVDFPPNYLCCHNNKTVDLSLCPITP